MDVIWWGQFDVPVGGRFERVIGPLELTVERASAEWRVSVNRTRTPETDAPDVGSVERYAVGNMAGPLRITPATADRAVVAEPVTPLHVVQGGSVTLYVSTPVWYRLEVGDPPIPIRDEFIARPSDTWFGPSTIEGELCYASRTSARLDLAEVPLRAERAVTAVTIRNDVDTLLPLDRVSLPAPQLSLYADRAGMLWTQDVEVCNRAETFLADIHLDARPPSAAISPQLVCPPRVAAGRTGIIRAFGALFR